MSVEELRVAAARARLARREGDRLAAAVLAEGVFQTEVARVSRVAQSTVSRARLSTVPTPAEDLVDRFEMGEVDLEGLVSGLVALPPGTDPTEALVASYARGGAPASALQEVLRGRAHRWGRGEVLAGLDEESLYEMSGTEVTLAALALEEHDPDRRGPGGGLLADDLWEAHRSVARTDRARRVELILWAEKVLAQWDSEAAR